MWFLFGLTASQSLLIEAGYRIVLFENINPRKTILKLLGSLGRRRNVSRLCQRTMGWQVFTFSGDLIQIYILTLFNLLQFCVHKSLKSLQRRNSNGWQTKNWACLHWSRIHCWNGPFIRPTRQSPCSRTNSCDFKERARQLFLHVV